MHRLCTHLSQHYWSHLYETGFMTDHGPDEDDLYECVHVALFQMLNDKDGRNLFAQLAKEGAGT
jgi:hypothetical protein